MKRIFIIVFVVLAAIIQVNAQVPNDTTEAVQDTTTKVVNQQNNHKATVKPTRKTTKPKVNTNNKGKEAEDPSTEVVNDTVVPQKVTPAKQENIQAGKPRCNFWRRLFGKCDDNNDCKQCENQLANVEKENKSLRKQVNDLKTKLGNAKTIMDVDDRDFYRSLIMSPLEKKYDSIQVEYYKKTVALFDHENKKEMNWVYEVYFPLLENYGKYNKDLAKLIQRVIKSFELLGTPDLKTEKELFNEGLEETEYFKKYNKRSRRNISQEIKYLEDVITDTKSLFEDSSKFTKENFEKQLRRLGIEK